MLMSHARFAHTGQLSCLNGHRRRSRRTIRSASPPNDSTSSTSAQNVSSLSSSDAVGKALVPQASTTDQLQHEFDELKAQEKGIPHRWFVVGAMVAAFVLCNMDKVCFCSPHRCLKTTTQCWTPKAGMRGQEHKLLVYTSLVHTDGSPLVFVTCSTHSRSTQTYHT